MPTSNGPSGWQLASAAGLVALAVTLGEERRDELLAHSALPPPGWERNVVRSCDRTHDACVGLGILYQMRHVPIIHLIVKECTCVTYELRYFPILPVFTDPQLPETASPSTSFTPESVPDVPEAAERQHVHAPVIDCPVHGDSRRRAHYSAFTDSRESVEPAQAREPDQAGADHGVE